MPPAPYDLLIFDWDGTILDSIGAIVDCTRETLSALAVPPIAEDAIRRLIGLGLRETVESLCPGCDDDLFGRVLETYRRNWLGTYCHRPAPFPGVGAMLATLRSEGYLLAVATAKSRRGLARDLEVCGLGPLFHASRTVDEAQSKPHPQMILDLLDELGAAPGRTIMVGDTVHDLLMAENAGVGAVAVASGAQPRAVLEGLGPRCCLESVLELPRWLAQRVRPLAETQPEERHLLPP